MLGPDLDFSTEGSLVELEAGDAVVDSNAALDPTVRVADELLGSVLEFVPDEVVVAGLVLVVEATVELAAPSTGTVLKAAG